MTDSITITMPLPERCLSPNSRAHWRKVAEAKKSIRAFTYFECILAGGLLREWDDAKASVKAFFSTNRKRDRDNFAASLKAVWDGVQDAGVIRDDSGLIHMPPEMLYDKENPRMEITIERVKGGDV